MKFVSNKSSQGIYLDLDLGLLISTRESVRYWLTAWSKMLAQEMAMCGLNSGDWSIIWVVINSNCFYQIIEVHDSETIVLILDN